MLNNYVALGKSRIRLHALQQCLALAVFFFGGGTPFVPEGTLFRWLFLTTGTLAVVGRVLEGSV